MALAGAVERLYIVADVVPYDHPVAQVIQEQRQRFRLFHTARGLVARDAVHGHRRVVVGEFEQRFEGIVEQHLAIANGHGADRDDLVAPRIESGGLRVQHHEPYARRGCVVGKGIVECRQVSFDGHIAAMKVDTLNSRKR